MAKSIATVIFFALVATLSAIALPAIPGVQTTSEHGEDTGAILAERHEKPSPEYCEYMTDFIITPPECLPDRDESKKPSKVYCALMDAFVASDSDCKGH